MRTTAALVFRILAGCNPAHLLRKAPQLKPLTLLISLVVLLFSPAITHAQTPAAIEGLEFILERQYASDTEGALDPDSEGVYLVSARVYQFDAAENADSTWETLVAAESVAADIPEDDDSVSYESTELEDVGDRATVLSLSAELDGGRVGAFRTIIIQTDATIVTVTAIAGSSDAALIADDIGIAMSEREAGDDDTNYDGMGGSTGGGWEIFLPADAEELGGLQAYADKETRPA